MENVTIVYECEAKWGRKAYIELRDNTVVFDDSMGEYGPIEFDIQVLIDALRDHDKKSHRYVTIAQQRLYTEEQVKEMIDDAHNGIDGYYDIFKKHTPIELPSDEEIIKIASQETNNINEQIAFNNGAIYVCKLIEEQILNK